MKDNVNSRSQLCCLNHILWWKYPFHFLLHSICASNQPATLPTPQPLLIILSIHPSIHHLPPLSQGQGVGGSSLSRDVINLNQMSTIPETKQDSEEDFFIASCGKDNPYSKITGHNPLRSWMLDQMTEECVGDVTTNVKTALMIHG